ncbi:MAG TPA: hypothetical protein DGH68_01470 [Bacteroidetes bacterium]|nr:hypothetical protein [Bacteroidota bacterium]
MKMSRRYRSEGNALIASVLFVALSMFGCSDEPSVLNSVGTQMLLTKIEVKTDTLGASGSSTLKQYVPMEGRTNLLGKSGEYNAYMLVQFSSLPNRDTVVVLSASIGLRGVTWFGDSAAPFGFNAYEISHAWGASTITWDSLTGLYNSDPGSLRGSFSGTVAHDTEWVSMNLDTAMVRRWLQTATHTNNYGCILLPTPNANVVRGFHAFYFENGDTLYPRLTVIARNLAGTVTDTSVYKFGQDTFVGNVENLNSNPELMYAQAGVSYRSTLKFDVSHIPRGAIINQAQLTLVYDQASSRLNRFTADTAVAAHTLLNATDYTIFELQGTRSTVDSLASSGKFRFDLRRQVQYWIRNASVNYGLLLRPSNANEFSSFDLLTFFNQSTQDATKRPQLIVKYTVESY